MSTAAVAAEIRRFLASEDAEVLCIKGKWGVGKTFAWRQFLADAEIAKAAAFNWYSYVSLFGLNSLDDLRYAIVEGTVMLAQSGTGSNLETVAAFIKNKFGKKGAPIASTLLTLMGKKDAGAAFAKMAFLAISNQVVCFDDLERAGKGLEARDVLGLASMLKEQRNCKVVLLLNDEKMKRKEREEFERQLEKVADVTLLFAPTSQEAAAIAIADTNPIGTVLRERIVKLGIVNIRIIKNIERWAGQVSKALKALPKAIQDQATATVTLAGWAKLQKDNAPDLEFLKKYNQITDQIRRMDRARSLNDQQQPDWMGTLEAYPYAVSDELDLVIIEGVDRGYFDDAELIAAAQALEARNAENPDNNSFTDAWALVRNTLALGEEPILDALYAGAMQNLNVISVLNLNSTIALFRKLGRDEQADSLLAAYVDANSSKQDIFNLRGHAFLSREEADPALWAAFERHYASFVDDRDPVPILLGIARNEAWDEKDFVRLAKLSSEEWEAVLDRCEGPHLSSAIESALRLVQQAGDGRDTFAAALTGALRRIAGRSQLHALRLRRFLGDNAVEAGVGSDQPDNQSTDNLPATDQG